MRKTILRRLEALEAENRFYKRQEQSLFTNSLNHVWSIVLAYYLGDLKSNDQDDLSPEDVPDAQARALNYSNALEMFPPDWDDKSKMRQRSIEYCLRYNDAYRRLFAKAGLDFDNTPANVLFDAFVTMVNQLPEPLLSWLRSGSCRGAEIEAGSNLPRWLTADNFLLIPRT